MREALRLDADADLTFLWAEAEVPLDLQYALAKAGYRNLQKFTGIADDRSGVREALKQDFEVDPAVGGPAARVSAAAVIAAWESAKEFRSKEVQLRAEAKSLMVTRPATVQERTGMRRVVEKAHGSMPSRETPSPDYLSLKLEEVEQDEPTASPLDEVASIEDQETQSLQASLDQTGRVRITKTRNKGKLPSSTEEFRLKLRVEGNCWLMLAVKFGNRSWLQGCTPLHWSRYCDFFLGDRCFNMKVPRGDAMEPLHPPWSVLLSYEYECRKQIFKNIRAGVSTLVDGLESVVRDSEIKEVFFTSPIALSSRARGPAALGSSADEPPRKMAKKSNRSASASGKGSGGKGQGGKGTKGAKKANVVGNTPDGRQICFAYNTSDGCKDKDCQRVHVCRSRGCLGSHPLHECPKK